MILLAAILLQSWQPAPCLDRKPGGDARCARRESVEADRVMAVQVERATARLRHCAPRNSTACTGQPRALALILAEQRAWLGWRDAHCNVVAFGMQGTSGETIVRDACKTELTVKRARELEEIGHP